MNSYRDVLEQTLGDLARLRDKLPSAVAVERVAQQNVYLSFFYMKPPSGDAAQLKYFQLPHAVRRGCSACLITAKPQLKWKDFLERHKEQLSFVTQVIDVDHLKKNYYHPDEKRALAKAFDWFLVDRKVVHIVPQILGKATLRNGKLPYPVKLSEALAPEALRAQLHVSRLVVREAVASRVLIGTADMPPQELLENALVATAEALTFLEQLGLEVRKIAMEDKSTDVALEVFQKAESCSDAADSTQQSGSS